MANWYEIEAHKRSVEEQKLAQHAYCGVLLNTREGRQMLCDMRRRISKTKIQNTNDLAMAQLWLEDFFDETIKLCGVTDLMGVIEKLEEVAAGYTPRPPEPPYVPEDHDE